jgi:sugar/nucleoside kinase (ribokinase family)
MRSALLLVWLAAAAGTPEATRAAERPPAVSSAGEREIALATAEMEKTRALVEAGAVPRSQLDRAQQALDDARDAACLRRTLYSPDLTEAETDAMLAAARRRLERRQKELQKTEQLADAGAVSRLSLTGPLEAVDSARRELDAALSRARLIHEIAQMARAELAIEEHLEPSAATLLPYGERYDGDGVFDIAGLARIEAAFLTRFAHDLPVSALGQTAVHRALGFDHRNRVDVALDPDQAEGVWLRQFLESHRIPYFAFRTSVPGKSTAPHIHIGPVSGRLSKGG